MVSPAPPSRRIAVLRAGVGPGGGSSIVYTSTVQLLHRGKVRDVYIDADTLILVASDRLSIYDVVLPTPIRDKGKLLTQLSLWWFDQLADIVPNHVISANDVPVEWTGRAIRCQHLNMVPVECIARGYLAGGGWDSYSKTGEISGVRLADGLRQGDRLPEPVFTPTTKTPPDEGHDEPMTFEQVTDQLGADLAGKVRDATLALYRRAAEIAESSGVILADTKFEFGLTDSGELILADEALTSDSSRYWRAEDWSPGQRQAGYDKQYVRDWSSELDWWDRTPPGPDVPDEVVAETSRRYIAIYERLTGRSWE